MTTETETAPAETVEGGVRARRAFTLKNFIPSQDWIMKEVVAGGKGTKKLVGRMIGIVTGYTDKINDINGVPTPSIALNGTFEAMSYIDGEVSRCVTIFLPLAYAEQLKAAFVSEPDLKAAEMDIDIGLEATGKTIPYEWVVIAHIEGKEVNALSRLRNARKPVVEAQKALPAAAEPAKLAAPEKAKA